MSKLKCFAIEGRNVNTGKLVIVAITRSLSELYDILEDLDKTRLDEKDVPRVYVYDLVNKSEMLP